MSAKLIRAGIEEVTYAVLGRTACVFEILQRLGLWIQPGVLRYLRGLGCWPGCGRKIFRVLV